MTFGVNVAHLTLNSPSGRQHMRKADPSLPLRNDIRAQPIEHRLRVGPANVVLGETGEVHQPDATPHRAALLRHHCVRVAPTEAHLV